jgi:hypothetical protein
VIAPPRQVDEVGVGAHREHLRVALAEVLVPLPDSTISVGQRKVKSMGQEKSTSHWPG